MNRKYLLLVLCSLAFSLVTSKPAFAESDLNIGVQLWSVKNSLKADFKGTIKALADMGFEGVELAGEYGEFKNQPEALRSFIESQGMQILGTHTNFGLLTPENINTTLDFYQRAGVPSALISWDDRAFKAASVWQTIADLNRLLPVFTARNIRFGYHNHAEEFLPYRDKTLWDHIAYSTPDQLVMQLDAGWASFAGYDPSKFVRQHPGRSLSIHLKAAANEAERGNTPLLGKDSVNWQQLIKAAIEVGGTQWLIVEQEMLPSNLSELKAVAASKQGLDEILSQMQSKP